MTHGTDQQPDQPSPRPAMKAPTCHGRPMTYQGGVYVCGKCGASYDPGARLTPLPSPSGEHERAKEPLPTRPPRPHPQGRVMAVAA